MSTSRLKNAFYQYLNIDSFVVIGDLKSQMCPALPFCCTEMATKSDEIPPFFPVTLTADCVLATV
ncbi:hypothetical protein RA28_16135 [Ruegeria sp. ANG-S4]|nr:hypothetical protein RA28_16135 [Ruegeria sp. ANG-S4]